MSTQAGEERFWLVLPDGSRVPILGPLTIGRGEDADVRIADQTVSRLHAKISVGLDGPLIEDAGSRYGTLFAGSQLTAPTRLVKGAQIRLGDIAITVDSETELPPPQRNRRAGPDETIVMPADATALGLRPAALATGAEGRLRPRVRSGWALKRLGPDEGQESFVLRDLRGGTFRRLDADDAKLFELLDGQRTVTELLVESERLIGPAGPGHLARLLADLADRGLLEGTHAAPQPVAPKSRLERVFRTRESSSDWAGDYFPQAYRHWGRAFFSPLSVTLLLLFALAGFGTFTYLIGSRYHTPFVNAHKLLIGGAVYVVGRFAIVAVHELAHGLALAHYGRRAPRAGLRLIMIFPYAFVDTSEAYFEPRSHRIVISAAGPISDLSLGALFAIACALSPKGSVSEVLFVLAFAAYVGAFFNLNPFLDRDGYHILVDFLREPGLKERARHQLAGRLSGATTKDDESPVLATYAAAGLIWSLVGIGFAIFISQRYYRELARIAPSGVVLSVFGAFYVLLALPLLMQLGYPLVRRARFGAVEVNRVVR